MSYILETKYPDFSSAKICENPIYHDEVMEQYEAGLIDWLNDIPAAKEIKKVDSQRMDIRSKVVEEYKEVSKYIKNEVRKKITIGKVQENEYFANIKNES